MDARTYHGANIDSDHYLGIAKVRARISNFKNTPRKGQVKFNSSKLKVKEPSDSFKEEISNKAQNLELNNLENVEFKWQAIKDILITTADSILGLAEKSDSKSWFDDECRSATKDKNQAYQSTHQKRFTRNSVKKIW